MTIANGILDASAIADLGGAVRRGIRVGLEGDSYSALHSAFGGGEKKALQLAGMSNRGYWGWANILNGGKFHLIENKGVGGNKSSDVLNRFDTSEGVAGLIADGCQLIHESTAINDFAAGATVAELAANKIEIWDRILAAGAIPAASTCTTGNTGAGHYSARQTVLEYNAWLRSYLTERPEVLLFDMARAVVDPESTTALPRSGAYYDQTHPGGVGARLIGLEINRVLSPLFPETTFGISSAADTYAVSSSSNQILSNPLFISSGGTTTPGSGSVTGDVALNWNIQVESGTAAVVASLVADPDGFGYRQRAVITNGGGVSSSVLIRPASSIHARVSGGDTINCEARASITDPVGLTEFNWYISQSGGADTQSRWNSLAADEDYPQLSFGGLFRIPPHTMTAGSAPTNFRPILRTTLDAGGSATVELGRAECRRTAA